MDTYQNLQKELYGSENEKIVPHASIGQLESEVNNGGLNQYFFNASGQNCFETLRELELRGKVKTAEILRKAISLINPRKLPEAAFIEKLRKREVPELLDEEISQKLSELDKQFLSYPDGSL